MLISVGMDTLFADILFQRRKKDRLDYGMDHRHISARQIMKSFFFSGRRR